MFDGENENSAGTPETTQAAASSAPAEGGEQAVAAESQTTAAPGTTESVTDSPKENVVEKVIEEVAKWIKCKSCNTEFASKPHLGEAGTVCPQCGAHTYLQE
jgi:rubrerythrin